MIELKVIKVGDALGVVLPQEVLTKLGADNGSTLVVTDTPGGLHLAAHDPAVAEQLEAGREFMDEYRETFEELAS